MKNLILNFLGYISIGILFIIIFGIFGITIIYFYYSGTEIEHPTLLYLGTLIPLIIIGFLIGYGMSKIDNESYKINVNVDFDPNKIEWDIIKVNTSEIKIVSRKHYYEKNRSTDWRDQAYYQIFNPRNSVTVVESNSSYLKCKQFYKGKNREFKSNNFSYDEMIFKFLLKEKKEINLFINKSNMRDYYFDLEQKI